MAMKLRCMIFNFVAEGPKLRHRCVAVLLPWVTFSKQYHIREKFCPMGPGLPYKNLQQQSASLFKLIKIWWRLKICPWSEANNLRRFLKRIIYVRDVAQESGGFLAIGQSACIE